MSRWLGLGTHKICAAMKNKHVKRLVILSSMGMGDDFMPFKGIRVLWAAMLRTCLRSAWKDLQALEQYVEESDLDYVLVRTVGIDPGTKKCGQWKLLHSREDGALEIVISKSDVALFMMKEALTPSLHRSAVTIGTDPNLKNTNNSKT